MSSLLKPDTYYSSYGDPGKIYPYPGVVSVTVNLPDSGKFIYTSTIEGADIDLRVFEEEVLTNIIVFKESESVASIGSLLSSSTHDDLITGNESVITGSAVLNPAQSYSFNYGDFNDGDPDGAVADPNVMITLSGD